VVATEVRTLAQRSAQAAKEIKELINDSVSKVEAGNTLVNSAGKQMDEIVGAVRHVAEIMGEITAASKEQSTGIEEINRAVATMDEMTQHNAALVEQAAAAAASMQERAQTLGQAVAAFDLSGVDATAATNADRLSPSGKPARMALTGN
jgi:methyl-accepting chemotaxis protein